jgi:hypothetical protein
MDLNLIDIKYHKQPNSHKFHLNKKQIAIMKNYSLGNKDKSQYSRLNQFN